MAARREWTEYWHDGQGASACLPGSPVAATRALERCWAQFAEPLASGARCADLACGSGAAGRAVLAARPDIRMTGFDLAQVPVASDAAFPIRSGVDLADLPLGDAELDGAVSQFGFEYADTAKASEQLARVLGPGAPCRLVVHHAGSVIVANNRERRAILRDLIDGGAAKAAGSSDRPGLQRLFDGLVAKHREHDLVLEIAHACRDIAALPQERREERADALEQGMARESALLAALAAAALDEAGVADLMALSNASIEWSAPARLEADGDLLAWRLDGRKMRTI